jgi:hypothetical protein
MARKKKKIITYRRDKLGRFTSPSKKTPKAVKKSRPSAPKRTGVKNAPKSIVSRPSKAKPKSGKGKAPSYIKAVEIAQKYNKKRRRISKVERAQKLGIDLEKDLEKIDIGKASEKQLRKEKSRLKSAQYRLGKKVGKVKGLKNKDVVRAQIRRYARKLDEINKSLGEYKQPRGFKKKKYQISDSAQVLNIYKWDAKREIDRLIDGGLFDLFIIDGFQHDKNDVVGIYMDIDDLETQADMHNIYYFRFTLNVATRTVSVSMSL